VPWADPAAVDLKKLKVAFFPTSGKTKTDDDTKSAITNAAKWLEGNVADVTEDLPTEILAELYEARTKLTSGDGWAFYQRLADKNHTKTFSPQVHDRLMKLTPVSTAEYVAAWMTQDTNKTRMLEWFSKYDVLLCPVAGEPAQPVDMGYDTPPMGGGGWSYTGAFNTTGWPVVVVRVGSSADGKLPIGIQVVANPWREDICIAVAGFLEGKSGGWKRPPI
jgi:amidase